MTTVQQDFPVPPAQLWKAIPAAIEAVKGKNPLYQQKNGVVTFTIGTSVLTWGMVVEATVQPAAGGARLTMEIDLRVGLIDYGARKRLGRRFITAARDATQR
ncbi:hypothetical protein [Fodinicola feengrottensis]|uniref:Uncharacterized protein n=1 Tax=Fodinicola feengrottensis TaxID=435914 RepID=A0ABN2G0N3_9ACTN|nr:hypothetical protein [Fodinicola feengrottensis]